MNNRMPAGEATVELIKSLAERSLKAMAELELVNTELQMQLAKEAQEMGIAGKIEYFDFDTNEYILNNAEEQADGSNGMDAGGSN